MLYAISWYMRYVITWPSFIKFCNMGLFSLKYSQNTPHSSPIRGELWCVFCEFKVCSVFDLYYRHAACSIMLYWPCYNEIWLCPPRPHLLLRKCQRGTFSHNSNCLFYVRRFWKLPEIALVFWNVCSMWYLRFNHCFFVNIYFFWLTYSLMNYFATG